jgi:type I restriction enzyme S subunit
LSGFIESLAKGIRERSTDFRFRDFAVLSLSFPPLPEQTAIAVFLDRKTAQIDQAVAIKEKQIDLLKERKQILIQNAVTCGLNPGVPMRNSGVEWIGGIPAHWKVSCSKWLFSQRKERARKSDEQLTASQKYGVISQQVFMELEGRRVTQVVYNNEILKHVEANDFVISMRSFQGGIEFCPYTGSVSSAYVPLIPGNQIHHPYYKYLFKCQRYIEALQSTSNLVRDGQALRYENFTMVDLPVVPLNEQEEIAQYIDTESAKIDRAISIQQQQIDKLKEYKATLINSAVTGKIKVPELVEGRVAELTEAPMPEPVEGELVEDSVA